MKLALPKGRCNSVLTSNLFPSKSKISPPLKALMSMLFLAMLSFQTYAQDDSWTLLKEESGVKVYYQIATCDSQEEIDPLEWANGDPTHKTFQLKVVNGNASTKSLTFSKVTKIDGSSEFETYSAASGTTLLETCDGAPELKLTSTENDNYPVAFIDFLNAFQITIKD